MLKLLKFYKYSGNGNDFIILDQPSIPLTPEIVARLCDRHFGVGADGVLLATFAPDHDARMQIFNSDGGEAEMCGNGIRCLVTFLDQKSSTKKDHYKIKTMNGSYDVIRKNGAFSIEMSEIKDENLYDLSAFNEFEKAFYVNTGVPHLVFLVKDAKAIDIKAAAPKYRHHKMFPKGTNVSFVEIQPEEQSAYVRTFERGVEDETHSCGTGLTAVGVALNRLKNWKGDIHLQTLGGHQKVSVGDKVFYSGEVDFCFWGDFPV